MRNLQDKIFAPIYVDLLLICLIMIPLVPLAVPYFFFFSSANAFSLDLSSRINAGSIPRVGNSVICAIRSTGMGTGLSSHMSPPCVTDNNYLTHAISKPKIHVLSSPAVHWCGWLIISPSWFTVMVYIKTLYEIFGNLVSSDTSWSKYLIFST
jgi:hypothetical protein